MQRPQSIRLHQCLLTSTLVIASLLAFTAAPAFAVEDAELQKRVDTLIEAIEREPTTTQNAMERAEVVWQWANQIAIERGFISINTTQILGRILNPPPGRDLPPRAASDLLDPMVEGLRLLDRDGALGTLSIDGPPVAPVLSHQTYVVTFTTGSQPVREGGRFLVASQFQTGVRMQTADPARANYVSIASSKQGLRFAPTTAPMRGPHGGFRGAIQLSAFRLESGDLEASDTVTLTYGDTSGGGHGMAVPSYSNDAILKRVVDRFFAP